MSDPGQYALLDRVPAISAGTNITAGDPPTDNLRYQKAQVLENGGLLDFAVRELQAAARTGKTKGTGWRPRPRNSTKMRDAMTERSRSSSAPCPTISRWICPRLPRPYWEALFPKPYWPDLKKFSSQNALDPYLVASLIRQESEFNPSAVSRANALGLMQLLPKVGSAVAKQEKLRNFSSAAIVYS